MILASTAVDAASYEFLIPVAIIVWIAAGVTLIIDRKKK